MRPLEDELRAALLAFEREGLRRSLRLARGVDFASNDYLGLSRDPRLRERTIERLRSGPLGAPASRLLGGTEALHLEFEAELARFKGTEAALLFPSGYQANLAVLTALLGPEDRAVSDDLNHASIIDGLRLSGAHKVVVPHLDLEAVEAALRVPHFGGRTFVVVESLFSMEGGPAPLDRYAELAERYGAALIVDDAHATGLYGAERGSGLLEERGLEKRVAAVVSTFGKALGLWGAFVAGPQVVIDWLVQRARPFVFSTAVPPLLVHAARSAIEIAAAEPWRRRRTIELAEGLRERLRQSGMRVLGARSPIVPVVLGSNERAVEVAGALEEHGFDARAVRPPSVPPDTARIRLSVHADRSQEEVEGLAVALERAVRRP